MRSGLALALRAAALLALGCAATLRAAPEAATGSSADDRFSALPAVHVDEGRVSPADREALDRLLKVSAAVLMSDAMLAQASAIEATYPRIFLNPAIGYKRPADAVSLLHAPGQGMHFRRTPVEFGKGAITGFNGRRWRMAISRKTLDRWLSDDPVVKSCAVNTVAHEITHTFVAQAGGGMVFIDGGRRAKPSRRSGMTGSYVIGQLAQCTWLAQQGRIATGDVTACVPVFYSRRGRFSAGRCDDFADGRPVRLS